MKLNSVARTLFNAGFLVVVGPFYLAWIGTMAAGSEARGLWRRYAKGWRR